MNLQNIMCTEQSTFADLLAMADREKSKLFLIVNEKLVLIGIMTDGDIRRAELRGIPYDTPVTFLMNRSFVSLTEADAGKTLNLDSRINQIPILDKNGCVVGITSFLHDKMIPVASPSLNGNEGKYVAECIKTQWISSQGSFVTEFEKMFSSMFENFYALTTSNGTTALHLALVALGIGKGDDVIVPASTFAATANTVVHAGANPVFVDVLPDTWCIDPVQVRLAITPKTKAIIPVHLYGHPADMEELTKIAHEFNLKLVEDCAESLGAKLHNRPTGVFGDAGCFSFFANKIITTGEGGMVICHDKQLYTKMRQLRDHGTSFQRRYWHDVIGYNYRLTNIQAAIGLAQIEQLNKFLSRRKRVAKVYSERLSQIPGISLPPQSTNTYENIYWLYSIKIDSDIVGMCRDNLQLALQKYGIDSRPFFPALPHQPAFSAYKKLPFPNALNLEKNALSLPGGNAFTEKDAHYVCDTLIEIISKRLE